MITFVVATRNAHKVGEIGAVLGNQARCVSLADLPPAPEVVEDAETFAGNALKKARAVAEWLRTDAQGACAGGETFVMADDSGLEVDVLNGEPGVRSARYASEGGEGNVPDALNNAKLLVALQSVEAPARTARFRCAIAIVPVGDPRESPNGPLSFHLSGNGDGVAGKPPGLGVRQSSAAFDPADNADVPPKRQRAGALQDADATSDIPREFRDSMHTPSLEVEDLRARSDHGDADHDELIFEGKCEGSMALAPSGSGGFGYDPLFIPSGFDVSFAELGDEIKNRISHRAHALELVKEHLKGLRHPSLDAR